MKNRIVIVHKCACETQKGFSKLPLEKSTFIALWASFEGSTLWARQETLSKVSVSQVRYCWKFTESTVHKFEGWMQNGV